MAPKPPSSGTRSLHCWSKGEKEVGDVSQTVNSCFDKDLDAALDSFDNLYILSAMSWKLKIYTSEVAKNIHFDSGLPTVHQVIFDEALSESFWRHTNKMDNVAWQRKKHFFFQVS